MRALARKMALGFGAMVKHDRRGKILFYHDIYSGKQYTDMATHADLFKAHVEAARRAGFKYVTHPPTGEMEVQVCLDDGFRGVYECAELFISNGAYPTIFIAPDLVGKQGYLTWSEILELQKVGFVFQSHTWSHRPLTEVPANELMHELADSKSLIADKLDRNVDDICFPCGLFSDGIVGASKEAGYVNLITSIPGSYSDTFPIKCPGAESLRTRNLVQFLTPAETVSVLKGGMSMYRSRYIKLHYQH